MPFFESKLSASLSKLMLLLAVAMFGCERSTPAPPTSQPSTITVASLVPAASDLIVGMGAADRLVAVSNFDVPDERTKHLPRVGDYQAVDWEKLAEIKPRWMVVQFDANRIPPGLQQRAEGLGIGIVNISNDRLADVFTTTEQLATAIQFDDGPATDRLRDRLQAVEARVQGKPAVRTLLVMDDSAQYVVGGSTFLGDVLKIAGGENVFPDTEKRYLQIDHEKLVALRPAVIIALRPSATPQEVDRARKTLATFTDVPAVRDGRVYILTDPWVLLPGYHVGELAERFADALHGTPTTGAAR